MKAECQVNIEQPPISRITTEATDAVADLGERLAWGEAR